jgi:hypothetical protein
MWVKIGASGQGSRVYTRLRLRHLLTEACESDVWVLILTKGEATPWSLLSAVPVETRHDRLLTA